MTRQEQRAHGSSGNRYGLKPETRDTKPGHDTHTEVTESQDEGERVISGEADSQAERTCEQMRLSLVTEFEKTK